MKKPLNCWTYLASFAALVATDVTAQSATTASHKPLVFRSTFDQYKPYRDEKITDWKFANDEVGRIGGWRAYLKEAAESAPEPATKPVLVPVEPTLVPARPVNPHAGHGVK
jgi:hypothetical protein